MFSFLLQKFAGRHHRKYVEKCRPIVARINEFEQSYQALTDEQLRAKTVEFRARVAQGEKLDAILPEAFAAVKNASSAGPDANASTSPSTSPTSPPPPSTTPAPAPPTRASTWARSSSTSSSSPSRPTTPSCAACSCTTSPMPTP